MQTHPPTATALSLKQASEQVAKDRTTLLRAIRGGDLSATKDDAGQWWIEPAELFRRYPRAQAHSVQNLVHAQVRTGEGTPPHTPDISRELALKEEQLAALQEERQRERRQLEDTISDLRRRLDSSEEERRMKDQQLTALLTDQRPKEPDPPTPVDEPRPAPQEAPKRRGLLTRLLGGMGRNQN